MTRKQEEIPVVYILSNGRSGTTLLDLLLGSAPASWTLGEAQLLPWELRNDGSPCGCGEDIRDCPFWQTILPEVPLHDEEYPIDFFRERGGGGKVLRWELLSDVLRGSVSERWRPAAEEYARTNARYFSEVRNRAEQKSGRQIQYLIDASMDPYRLLWMTTSDRFDFRVVHLTKSPPSFVYSMVKNDLPGHLSGTVRMAGRWLIENGIMLQLCSAAFARERVFRLRYEELAGRPQEIRRELSSWLELDFPVWQGNTFRAYENHAISGNKMRWEDTEIQLDEAWRTNLPWLHKKVVGTICSPLAWVFGY